MQDSTRYYLQNVVPASTKIQFNDHHYVKKWFNVFEHIHNTISFKKLAESAKVFDYSGQNIRKISTT